MQTGAMWAWRMLLPLALLAARVAQADEDLEKESPKDQAMNLGISVMLLLTVTFVMLLFWLVHHWDAEIKRYSWQVISATISIFCAVLLFQAVDGVVKYYFLPEGSSEVQELGVNLIQMLSWFVGLQIFLAVLAGAIDEMLPVCLGGKRHHHEPVAVGHKVRSRVKAITRGAYLEEGHVGSVTKIDEKGRIFVNFPYMRKAKVMPEHVEAHDDSHERKHLILKCWATLLGHITGFATINFFAVVQNCVSKMEDSTEILVFAVAPLTWACVFGVSMMTRKCRKNVALADDGEEDEEEKLWSEEVEETEDDVAALSVSFIICQWLRLHLTGHLPSVEGEDRPEDFMPTREMIATIFAFGVVVSMIESFRLLFIRCRWFPRVTCQLRDICSMTLSWCFFFGFTWIVTTMMPGSQGMFKQISIAGMATGVAIVLIFVLDKIADLDVTGPEVDKIVRSVVLCFGILIGFSWEKAFDVAVEYSSEETFKSYPVAVKKLVMSVILCFIVIPNWRNHILPTIMKLSEEQKQEDEIGEQTGMSKSDVEKRRSQEARGPQFSGESAMSFSVNPLKFTKSGSYSESGGAVSVDERTPGRSPRTPGGALSQPLLEPVSEDAGLEGLRRQIEEMRRRNDTLEKRNTSLEAGSAGAYLPPDVRRASQLERRNFQLESNLVEVIAEIKSLQAVANAPAHAGR